MSEHATQPVIALKDVGKMYRTYASRNVRLLDALGLSRLAQRYENPKDFWAIRHIDFELKAGQRLGIIGRNGAGKSTLLKLITGVINTTEGSIRVTGDIQALMTAGTGFHPEFTGYENIRSSLIYQGLSNDDIKAAIEDIADYTELGRYLDQPIKTYSSGMLARLSFATATALKPKILIIDEVLGAGDAYFTAKSAERMQKLVEESGASVLLVSHALSQVQRYCSECIWLERGKIIERGRSIDVINSYEAFIRNLEDRRLKARNRKKLLSQQEQQQNDNFADSLVLCFQLYGNSSASIEVCEITLLKDHVIQEQLRIGDVQDSLSSYLSAVILNDHSTWSDPIDEKIDKLTALHYRSLQGKSDTSTPVSGYVVFYDYLLSKTASYEFNIRYRVKNAIKVTLAVSHNQKQIQLPIEMPQSQTWGEWVWRYSEHK